MTDDEINNLILDFLEERGGYVAAASESELFWMLKNAIVAQRERDAALIETMPNFASPRDCAAAIRSSPPQLENPAPRTTR